MKNIRVIIKAKNYEKLKVFSDDSYLYNYIVNNYTELYEDNIFRNPDFLQEFDEYIFYSKNNITEDDEFVWKETNLDLRKQKISFCTLIIDLEQNSYFVYNNLQEKVAELDIDKDTDVIDIINKIENYNYEIELEEDLEV